MQKRILTIFISDMQGYTSRQARSTRLAMEQLVAQHRELVLPALRAFGGRLVKSMGDAFLATFDSPTDAVLAAVQVQKSLRVRNAALADASEAMYVRIATATGEVSVDDDGDVFGPPVNLAARLQTIAEPGAVYLSETTFLSMNQSEIAALEVGHRVLKGIPGEVKVYRIADDFIEQARLLTQAELERAMQPVRREMSATRRNTIVLMVLSVLVLGGVAALLLRKSADPTSAQDERIDALVQKGDLTGAAAQAYAAWQPRQDDSALRDRWLDLARRELYQAQKTGRIETLYRERENAGGWFDQNIGKHQSELGDVARFRWLLATWLLLNEPLAPDVPDYVAKAIQANDPAAKNEPEFRALLDETVRYSEKDEAAHAVYEKAWALVK